MSDLSNAYLYKKLYRSEHKTQEEMVIEYMEKYGSITQLEALIAFRCMRLGARIWDLRKAGYAIKSKIVDGDTYSVYWIKGEDEE